jgi:hypothetical protein
MVERTREYFGNQNTQEFQAWLGSAHRHAASRLQFTRLFLHQPLNTSLQSATHRPSTAKLRIRVDVNLNLTYHNIVRAGF